MSTRIEYRAERFWKWWRTSAELGGAVWERTRSRFRADDVPDLVTESRAIFRVGVRCAGSTSPRAGRISRQGQGVSLLYYNPAAGVSVCPEDSVECPMNLLVFRTIDGLNWSENGRNRAWANVAA